MPVCPTGLRDFQLDKSVVDLLSGPNNAIQHFMFFFILSFIGFGAIWDGTFFSIPEILRVP